MSGIRQPTDHTGGIWDYLIDHSISEGRVYFPDGSWIDIAAYRTNMDWSSQPENWKEFAEEFQNKVRDLGHLQNDTPDPFVGDEFCDGLG